MDLTQIVKVEELTDPFHVDKYLETGRWKLLATAGGTTSYGEAYVLYALGWLGPEGENDASEFPVDFSIDPDLP